MKCVVCCRHRYSSSIEENGVGASIECKPSMGSLIESHNVTAVLAKRGNVHVDSILLGIDNKFKPYHFQTHAGDHYN